MKIHRFMLLGAAVALVVTALLLYFVFGSSAAAVVAAGAACLIIYSLVLVGLLKGLTSKPSDPTDSNDEAPPASTRARPPAESVLQHVGGYARLQRSQRVIEPGNRSEAERLWEQFERR